MRHFTLIFLVIFIFLGFPKVEAQTDLPPPIIGIHDVITYYVGPSVKSVIEIEEEGEDTILVSNNCGFETSHIVGFELKSGLPSKVIANQHMGEWCETKFISERRSNDFILVFPTEKFESEFIDNEQFVYGYQVDTLNVYEYDGEYYLDLGNLYEKTDRSWEYTDDPRFQTYKDMLTNLPIDDFSIGQNITVDDFIQQFNPQIYTLSQDGYVNLRRAVPLSKLYPRAINALLESDL